MFTPWGVEVPPGQPLTVGVTYRLQADLAGLLSQGQYGGGTTGGIHTFDHWQGWYLATTQLDVVKDTRSTLPPGDVNECRSVGANSVFTSHWGANANVLRIPMSVRVHPGATGDVTVNARASIFNGGGTSTNPASVAEDLGETFTWPIAASGGATPPPGTLHRLSGKAL
jgi:hypothetical protein